MTYVVNGVVWKTRFHRWWGYLLLEYTEAQIKISDMFESLQKKK